jgi:NTP pyrophosphatase (non-canonical NTP hydrolase)
MEDLKDINSQNKEVAAFAAAFRSGIKDSFEDEIADAFLRLMDICGMLDIDIEKHIIMKSEYNKLRPAKHGKEY